MASNTFRDSMNSLGWSRRDPGSGQQTANTSRPTGFYGTLSKYNPFGGDNGIRLPFSETDEGPGAPLPARTRREEEEGWLALSRWDRLLIFGGLNLAAVALFVVCFTLMPILSLNPRKFAILWSMASALFLSSWAVLMGPMIYATYFGSIGLTLYFAIGLRSTLLTLLSSIVQLVALAWYLISYFPMGSTGLRFAARFGTSRVTGWMND